MSLAPAQKLPPGVKDRGGIALLAVDCEGVMLGRNRKPRALRAGETAVRRMLLPRHRRAGAITAAKFRPERDAVGISQVIEGELRFGQSQFLALVHANAAA